MVGAATHIAGGTRRRHDTHGLSIRMIVRYNHRVRLDQVPLGAEATAQD